MPRSLSLSAFKEKLSTLRNRRRHNKDPADPDPTTGESFEPGNSHTGTGPDDGGYTGTYLPYSSSNATGSRDPTEDEKFLQETMSKAASGSHLVDCSPPGADPGARREQFEKSFATCKTRELRFGLIYAYWYFSFGELPSSLTRREHPLWTQAIEVENILSEGKETKPLNMVEYGALVADAFYDITKPARGWEAVPRGTTSSNEM